MIGSLGTSDLARVRLGIHPGRPLRSGAEYVLAPVRRSQDKELDDFVGYAADAVDSIIAEGVAKAMTKFNRRAPGSVSYTHLDVYKRQGVDRVFPGAEPAGCDGGFAGRRRCGAGAGVRQAAEFVAPGNYR